MPVMLTAVLCPPGEDACVVEIAPGFEALQEAVGGPIGHVRLRNSVMAWIHDEGLLDGLPWNRQIGPQTFIAGPMLVLGDDPGGNDRSLTPDEQRDILNLLNVHAPRLNHTKASSMKELGCWLGKKAIRIYTGEIGFMKEICTMCGQELAPEHKGYCPKCTVPGDKP